MAHRTVTRVVLLEWSGRLLLSFGIMLGCLLGLRLAREEMDRRVLSTSAYLMAANTPVFSLPPATPLPTAIPTPTSPPTPQPTAKPPSLPAIRISIPAIRLNSSISEITPVRKIRYGRESYIWDPLPYVVAHYYSSGFPGDNTNIVLNGHNNTLGEVFKNLDRLEPGDEVILFTEAGEYHYQVEMKFMVPYLGSEAEGDATLKSYSGPTSSEKVTLISCWPYATNSHRIVVIAVPLTNGVANGSQ